MRWEKTHKWKWTTGQMITWVSSCFLKFVGRDLQSSRKCPQGFPTSFRKWESGWLSTGLWTCKERNSRHGHLVVFEYRKELRWKYNKLLYINWFWNRALIHTQCVYQNKMRESKPNKIPTKKPVPNRKCFYSLKLQQKKCVPTFSQRSIN